MYKVQVIACFVNYPVLSGLGKSASFASKQLDVDALTPDGCDVPLNIIKRFVSTQTNVRWTWRLWAR